uniref:ATP synthase complex subunit 8 n=1 Tax=Uleiota sp. BMNH 833935 TaxID=1903802 RepID=A0A343A456_9CUCU|nr:ATP synthase F0 subunit 8 [Uleiota sp. BMNH 833935]
MPQMAPMNWLILYMFFSLIFLYINCLNFYMFSYSNKSYFNTKKKSLINWKW